MWPDRISNPGPLALESDALPTALRGPAILNYKTELNRMYKIAVIIGDHTAGDHPHTDKTICYNEDPQQKYCPGTVRIRAPAGRGGGGGSEGAGQALKTITGF